MTFAILQITANPAALHNLSRLFPEWVTPSVKTGYPKKCLFSVSIFKSWKQIAFPKCPLRFECHNWPASRMDADRGQIAPESRRDDV